MASTMTLYSLSRIYKNCARSLVVLPQRCNLSRVSRNVRPSRYNTVNLSEMDYKRNTLERKDNSMFSRFKPGSTSSGRGGRRARPVSSQNKTNYYTKKIRLLLDEGRVKEAGLLLMDKNIAQDIVMFNMIMSAYGKQGNLKNALLYYNLARSNNLQPNGYTYTGLFNMYAEYPEHCTSSNISKIYTEMTQRIDSRTLSPNLVLYNAAIKAFSRHGDVFKAFTVYEDLCSLGLQPDKHTFAMLLIGCIQVRSAGTSKVLDVLNEMQSRNIKPNIYLYNLFLRVFRDLHQRNSNERKAPTEDLGNTLEAVQEKSTNMSGSDKQTPKDTKAVFPGVESFLQLMLEDEVAPNIITCYFLSQLSDSEKEVHLIFETLNTFHIVPDLPLLNSVIRCLSRRGNIAPAKKYFESLGKWGLKADYNTYLALAYTCTLPEHGRRFIDKIKSDGMSLSPAIFDTLMTVAARSGNYQYLIIIMKRMLLEMIEPDERILRKLQGIADSNTLGKRRKQFKFNPTKSMEDLIVFREYLPLWKEKFST